MRTTFILALLVSLLGATGCNRLTSSGIPATLNSDAPMSVAGRAQGIKLASGSSGVSAHFSSYETEHRFYAAIASGTGGQLMAAYRQEVENVIAHTGARIYGTGVTSTGKEVRDFSYDYTWNQTDGMVKAFSFTGTNGEVQIVIVCYEHTR